MKFSPRQPKIFKIMQCLPETSSSKLQNDCNLTSQSVTGSSDLSGYPFCCAGSLKAHI